jgi:hypothetical protein
MSDIQSGFVHDIDPVLTSIGSVPLYRYGLAYSLGFIGLLVWFRSRQSRLGFRQKRSVTRSRHASRPAATATQRQVILPGKYRVFADSFKRAAGFS